MNPTGVESGIYTASSSPLRLESLRSSLLRSFIAPMRHSVSKATSRWLKGRQVLGLCGGNSEIYEEYSVKVVGVILGISRSILQKGSMLSNIFL